MKTYVKAIRRAIIPGPNVPHKGARTHTHAHVIVPTNLRTVKVRVQSAIAKLASV
jgi:hypothetical protein